MRKNISSIPSAQNPLSAYQVECVIRGLYIGLLGREADAPGLTHWKAIWSGTPDVTVIAAGIANSEEYRQRVASGRQVAPDVEGLTLDAVKSANPLLLNEPLTIVDIGAQNLESEDHVYANVGRHAVPHRIIGFEPLEHRRAERMRQSSNESLILLPAFIGDGKEHTFYINEPDATSSLLPFNKHITARLVDLENLRTVSTEPANTTTLDEALRDVPIVDLLKLDIQGFELTALRHAVATLQRTLVIHCEVSFVEIYDGQAMFSEIEQYLRTAGFSLVDLRSQCRYPLTGTPFLQSREWLGWADAVFFRQLPDTATWREQLAQSLIALTVYGKPSLASWLSRNLGSSPALQYMQTLNMTTTPST